VKNNKGYVIAFLLGAAFGRAVFLEAGHLINLVVFGGRKSWEKS